jgi:prepilin-type processing-associated H-X9-DG protein
MRNGSSGVISDCGYVSTSVIGVGAPAAVFSACRGDFERYRPFEMNSVTSKNSSPAFSLVELLVVAAILVVLVLLLRPVNPGRRNSAVVVCMSNLKQTVLGFARWSDDNGGSWPWQVSMKNGGTLELIPNGLAAVHFLTLSNYVKDQRLLACPTDPARTATNNYSSFDNQNLSYFAGLDALASSSNGSLSILSGDRHLQMSGQPVKPGLLVVSNTRPWGWTKELHTESSESPVGNLSFADGHVERVRAVKLSNYFQRQPAATNRLVIP